MKGKIRNKYKNYVDDDENDKVNGLISTSTATKFE